MSHLYNEILLPAISHIGTSVIAFDGQTVAQVERSIANEVPVNFVYGGIPFAVMMATPSDFEDFAYGFSLSENIIQIREDIRSIKVEPDDAGFRLMIDLTAERLHKHLARKRAIVGRTGCGLCGIDDLDALPQANPLLSPAPKISARAIHMALKNLENHQPLNAETRAVHGAAWANNEGRILLVREDVGRHNALDKLIGSMMRTSDAPSGGFAVLTSRCSFELVEKAASFGIRTLVTISAPTSLALERARNLDITLVGVARHDAMTVFHGIDRIME